MKRPVNSPYTVTTTFGVPDPNALFGKHSGYDYAVPLNRPVYAPASGQLRNVVSRTGGNMVQIFDGKMWHRLMHNNSFSRGDGPVNEGDEVAKAGTTGLSTGVHVHWDVANKAVPTSFSDFVNPEEYIKQGGTTMLSLDDRYKVWRMSRPGDPTPDEVKGWEKMDDATFVANLWNNGGNDYKKKEEALKGNHDVKVDGIQYKREG